MGYLDSLVKKYEKSGHYSENLREEDFLTEAEYTKKINHLRVDILDIERFVKVNDCHEVTNPTFYTSTNVHSPEGLLSDEIFGLTKEDRAGTFAYIDLHGWYLDPSCYKSWCKIDSHIKDIVHKTDTFSLDPHGYIVQDDAGSNGVDFLKKNIDKIKFKHTDSQIRDLRIKYLDRNRNKMFIRKYIVIPPYYRDTNTTGNSIGINGINKLYANLLTTVRSLQSTREFGFDTSGPMQGKVQETLVAIYDWACGNKNAAIGDKDEGLGIGQKRGILKSAAMSKTSNYAARLVISSADLKVESPDELMTNFDTTSVPLAAVIATFRPFVQFHVRAYFENLFLGFEQFPVIKADGEVAYATPKDPLIEFSDERIKKEMERFIKAPNDRFVPIKLPIEQDDLGDVFLQFKCKYAEGVVDAPVYHRPLTWCDVFFIAAKEAVKGRMILITRYPVDTRYNEIATKCEVASTKETEQVYFNNQYYKYYPKIRSEDIGTDTNNRFSDALKMSNLYCPGLVADYDGDTVSIKGVYTDEANEELKKFANSKMNFINLGPNNMRASENDCIQSLYVITKILTADQNKLTDPQF